MDQFVLAMEAFTLLTGDAQFVLVVGVLVLMTFIAISLYFSRLNSVIHDIKKHHFAMIMDYLDDVLWDIYNNSVDAVIDIAKERSKDLKLCPHGEKSCNLLYDSYDYQIQLAKQHLDKVILISTRDRIKTAIHKNGFHTFTGERLDKYKIMMANRIISKNRNILDKNGFNNYPLISMTDDSRITKAEALKRFSELVDEIIRIKYLENKEIKMLWRHPLKVISLFETKK